MTRKMAIFAIIILMVVGFVSASTYRYTYGGVDYVATITGSGDAHPGEEFTLVGGEWISGEPADTYTVYNDTIVFDTQAWESPGGGSITTMYDTDPVILVGNDSVFKTWYQADIDPQAMGYAESTDGITWYKYSGNPVLAGYFAGDVVKDNDTYYMFATAQADTGHVFRFHSDNGTAWTADGAVANAPGGWATSLLYQDVWQASDGSWKMLVSGNDAGNDWGIGLWEASIVNGTWTASGSNPVITAPATGDGRGLVYLPSGTFEDSEGYTWTYPSAADTPSAAAQYTDSMRFRTVNPHNLTSWSANPITYLNVGPVRKTNYPGDWQGRSAQDYIMVGSLTYEFYTYNTEGHPGYNGLMTTTLTREQIVATDEMYPNLTYQQKV